MSTGLTCRISVLPASDGHVGSLPALAGVGAPHVPLSIPPSLTEIPPTMMPLLKLSLLLQSVYFVGSGDRRPDRSLRPVRTDDLFVEEDQVLDRHLVPDPDPYLVDHPPVLRG